METLSHILQHKIIAIIRGAKPKDILQIANALNMAGIKTMEITINSPKAMHVIETLANEMSNEMLIGAGTVLDPETARTALLAGAKFIISPTLNTKTIKMTKRYGAISIPGAFTPTEILKAYTNGGDIIKVFPASVGAAYFSDLSGPLPHIPLMPTGGVNINNIAEFKKAGAVAFGLGSALVNTKEEVNELYLQNLTERARKFKEAVSDIA
ncbi:bifunctional 4-hydroxy-2-oxoglutarate aldolase/2-dehydro-3-deoxy-phosphogluconate aldolase [Rubrolithibacter danxiaensis]|uniref:bifunctional 4-hydroxy-2-oxoglutarate aldolase/2-dehydro-3-deoxy-phosphogluconate aldolase n=1 Tax=Rubrolithibacter danxiaensis TaxID=3390805 RepID=UPI003BF857DD